MGTLDPKEEFLRQELEEFGAYLVRQARATLVRRRIRVDDELLNSVAAQVVGSELQLLFAAQGRFTDMGAGNAYHKGKYTGTRKDVNRLKGRKPAKWYSRLAYGAVYGTLANNISNKYVEEVANGLRSTMQQP